MSRAFYNTKERSHFYRAKVCMPFSYRKKGVRLKTVSTLQVGDALQHQDNRVSSINNKIDKFQGLASPI